MIQVPALHRIPMSYPLVKLCGLDRKVRKVRRQLRALYLSLGGRKTAQPCISGDIALLREAIAERVDFHIKAVFDELQKTNPEALQYRQEYDISVSRRVVLNWFSDDGGCPSAEVTIEIGVLYWFYLAFLKELKEERPTVYDMMRSIAHLLHVVIPKTSVQELHDYICETAEMGEDEATAESHSEYLANVEKELAEYQQHVTTVKGSYRTLVRRIRRLYAECSWELTEKEKWFVRTALQFFAAWSKWDGEKIEMADRDYYDDRNTIDRFFALLWQPDGAAAEEISSWAESYGQQSVPAITFRINDIGNLKALKEAIRSFVLLEVLLAGGSYIWPSQG